MIDRDLLEVESPGREEIEFLEGQIYAYNVAATNVRDGRELGILVRDKGEIVAGLYGYTWGGVLDVRYLWVREDRRGRGYGKSLLQAAEDEAVRRGCVQAVLETHSFQAPEFYRKLGYEVYGTLADYPSGYNKHHLKKSLSQEVADL